MATIYKTTANGVYKTADNGTTWADVTPESGYEYVDSVKKSNATVYVLGNKDTAGVFSSKVWKTIDAGINWPTSAIFSSTTTGSINLSTSTSGVDITTTAYAFSAKMTAASFLTLVQDDAGGAKIHLAEILNIAEQVNTLSAVAVDDPDASISRDTDIIMLTPDTAVGFYKGGSGGGTVTGIVIKIGGSVQITQGSPLEFPDAFEITASRRNASSLWLIYNKVGTPGSTLLQKISVTGETLALDGGAITLSSAQIWRHLDVANVLNQPDDLVLFYRDPANSDNPSVARIYNSGNTVSAPTVLDEDGVDTSAYVHAARRRVHKANSASTLFAITWTDAVNERGKIAVVDATNDAPPSSGSPVTFDTNARRIAVTRVDDTRLLTFYLSNASDVAQDLSIRTFSRSGTAVTDELNQSIIGVGADSETTNIHMIDDANSKFLGIAGNTDTLGYYLGAITATASPGGQARGIGIDVSGNQKNTYITYCNGESLQLAALSAIDLATIRTTTLGEGTLAETASNIRVAHPRTTAIESDRVWVTGRMINPAGLSSSPVHVIISADGGATFNIYQNGWGDDFCGPAHQRSTAAPFYSVRNFNDIAQATFYKDKVAKGAVPFNVHNRAIFMPESQNWAILGGSNVQSQRIYYSGTPFGRWYDVTTNYPNAASSNGGAITSVMVVA